MHECCDGGVTQEGREGVRRGTNKGRLGGKTGSDGGGGGPGTEGRWAHACGVPDNHLMEDLQAQQSESALAGPP